MEQEERDCRVTHAGVFADGETTKQLGWLLHCRLNMRRRLLSASEVRDTPAAQLGDEPFGFALGGVAGDWRSRHAHCCAPHNLARENRVWG